MGNLFLNFMNSKHYLQVQERSVCFFDLGQKEKSTIVLIPGFPLTKESWELQVKKLAENFRVISFDLAGLGESLHKTGFVTIDSHVTDLISVLDHCNVNKFIVLGLSMGGYVALRATNLFPDRIQSLILANTRADADSNSAKTKRFKQINSLQNGEINLFADTLAEALLSDNYKNRYPDALSTLAKSISKQSVSGLCGNLMAMAARHDAKEFLEKIQCPVLIITGDLDEVIPHEEGEKIHNKIAGSKIVKLENCGHLSNLEQPDMFLKELQEFLRNVL